MRFLTMLACCDTAADADDGVLRMNALAQFTSITARGGVADAGCCLYAVAREQQQQRTMSAWMDKQRRSITTDTRL